MSDTGIWWISFATAEGFLGAFITRAHCPGCAVQAMWREDLLPEGDWEAKGCGLVDEVPIPPEMFDRLLTEAEAVALKNALSDAAAGTL